MAWERVRYATIMVSVHLIAGGCSSQAPETNVVREAGTAAAEASPRQVEEGKLVLAFGDSLYAGYGLAPAEAFPAQLEKALQQQGLVATVHNAGVSGDTSAAGLQRLSFTLEGLPRKPELAIVGLGGNDMLRGLDPAATQANLLEICRQLRHRGIKVVLTGMLAAPNLGQDYGKRFNALFSQVADQCEAGLYPFFLDGVVADRALMLPDRVHPNASGVRRIVAKIQPMIARELLRED